MKLIRPRTIDETTLSSSNIAEGDPGAWASGTTYAADDRASVATGTTLQLYKSLSDSNVGNDPATSPDWWVEDGVTYPEWDDATIFFTGNRSIDTTGHRIYEALSGNGFQAFTVTIASPGVLTLVGHGFAAGAPIMLFTTGALPTGLAAGTLYYVVSSAADTFSLAATAGGTAINTSGSQSGSHSLIANPNINKDPTDAANAADWLDIGPTNRWAMFDEVVGTVTSHPYAIDLEMVFTGRIDSLAMLGIANAISARIVMSTAADGTVYDQTFSLISTDGISNWYTYFFEDVERKQALLVDDLPAYVDPTFQVTIEGNGSSPVEVGILSIGLAKELGETQHDGAQIGITDYSRKEVDDFGNYSIRERAFSRRGSFQLRLPKSAVDGVHKVLSDYRATPAVYSASGDYGATLIFGFFRDFNIEIDYPLESLVSIEIEGLT